MAKKPKGTRREKREQRKKERQAQEAAELEARAQRNKLLVGIVAVTLAACTAIYVTELPSALLGIALLVGIGVFLAVGLGGLGSSVKPRDRAKSGNIDYGN
jgi:hypothetical protein